MVGEGILHEDMTAKSEEECMTAAAHNQYFTNEKRGRILWIYLLIYIAHDILCKP